MRIAASLLVLLASTASVVAGPANPVAAGPVLQVRLLAAKAVLGEPVRAWVELRNPGQLPSITLDGFPPVTWFVVPPGEMPPIRVINDDVAWPTNPPPDLPTLLPDAVRGPLVQWPEIGATRLRRAGDYDLIGEAQFPGWQWGTPPPVGFFSGVVRSTATPLTIEEPHGVDRQAYDAFNGVPAEYGGEELLRRFPTSIYAGYVAISCGHLNLIPVGLLHSRDGWERQIREFGESLTIRRWQAQEREEAQLVLAVIETFSAAHPDFAMGMWLRARQAALLAYFGRYEEARVLAKKVIAENVDPRKVKESRDLVDYLVQKGYLKAE